MLELTKNEKYIIIKINYKKGIIFFFSTKITKQLNTHYQTIFLDTKLIGKFCIYKKNCDFFYIQTENYIWQTEKNLIFPKKYLENSFFYYNFVLVCRCEQIHLINC